MSLLVSTAIYPALKDSGYVEATEAQSSISIRTRYDLSFLPASVPQQSQVSSFLTLIWTFRTEGSRANAVALVVKNAHFCQFLLSLLTVYHGLCPDYKCKWAPGREHLLGIKSSDSFSVEMSKANSAKATSHHIGQNMGLGLSLWAREVEDYSRKQEKELGKDHEQSQPHWRSVFCLL